MTKLSHNNKEYMQTFSGKLALGAFDRSSASIFVGPQRRHSRHLSPYRGGASAAAKTRFPSDPAAAASGRNRSCSFRRREELCAVKCFASFARTFSRAAAAHNSNAQLRRRTWNANNLALVHPDFTTTTTINSIVSLEIIDNITQKNARRQTNQI